MEAKKTPLVSILMNCYNGAEHLRKATESVLAQSYRNWELIFWDNCSTDSSAKVYKDMSDQRLKYFLSSEHTPLYEARNKALDVAKGELIAFLDVDDVWDPTKLEKQVVLFESPEVAAVYTNYETLNTTNKKRFMTHRRLKSGRILGQLLKNYQVGILTLVLRSEVINRLSERFDPRFQVYGDYDLVLRLAVNNNIIAIEEPLATYIVHGNNLYGRDYSRNLCELEILIEKFKKGEPEIITNENFKHVKYEVEWLRYKSLGEPGIFGMLKHIVRSRNQLAFARALIKKLFG